MLDELLAELASSGWTISWAFQYAPDEWRMSIIRYADVGAEQGTYVSHCAIASTFADALEDCLANRNEAEFVAEQQSLGLIDKSKPLSLDKLDLKKLGLVTRKQPKVERRI